MIVVMRVQAFEVEQRGGVPVKIELDFRPMIGYLPVYEALEADGCRDWEVYVWWPSMLDGIAEILQRTGAGSMKPVKQR